MKKHQNSASLAFVKGTHRNAVTVFIWWRHHVMSRTRSYSSTATVAGSAFRWMFFYWFDIKRLSGGVSLHLTGSATPFLCGYKSSDGKSISGSGSAEYSLLEIEWRCSIQFLIQTKSQDAAHYFHLHNTCITYHRAHIGSSSTVVIHSLDIVVLWHRTRQCHLHPQSGMGTRSLISLGIVMTVMMWHLANGK